MKRDDLKAKIGKVVCLDLISGERPVGKLKSVSEDSYAVITDPHVYYPVPVGGTSMKVQVLPYAGPLYSVKEMKVSTDHIIQLLDVPAQMEQAYMQQTSGLVTATAPSIILPN